MRVILDKPHTHACKTYEAGAALDLGQIEAEWLISQNGAHRAGNAKPTTRTAVDAGVTANPGVQNHE